MGKRRRRSSSSRNAMRSQGRGPFAKLSKIAFKNTGMPLSRLLILGLSVLATIAISFYVTRDRSSTAAELVDPSSVSIKKGETDGGIYLDAVRIPSEFYSLALPVKLEKLDEMIARCNQLLAGKNKYKTELRKKIFSLTSLRCITSAEIGVDLPQQLDVLNEQSTNCDETERKINAFTMIFIHLSVLVHQDNGEIYDRTIKAIEKLSPSDFAPQLTTTACYRAIVYYYQKSNNRAKAAELLQILGEQLAANETQFISDLGLALIDLPNFSKFENRLFNRLNQFDGDVALGFMNQARKTPPQSPQTYDTLLWVPEQFLQTGNADIAKKVITQLNSIMADCPKRLQDYVTRKLQRLTTRVNLLEQPLRFTDTDSSGKRLKSNPKKKTIILFWDPAQSSSEKTLTVLSESSLYDSWTTEIVMASIAELKTSELNVWKRLFPRFTFLTNATAKTLFEQCGINEVPYQLILDKDDTVIRMGKP